MKAIAHNKDLYSRVRLPEIIFWVIGIVVFTSLIFGFNLNAQENDKYRQDTIRLKSGQTISCLIMDNVDSSQAIRINHFDLTGRLVVEDYPLDQISYYSINQKNYQRNKYSTDITSNAFPIVYISFGGGWPGTFGLGGTLLLVNNMGGSISYRYRTITASNKPADYYPGLFDFFSSSAVDEINIVSLCFLKAFPLSNTKLIRFSVEGGPSLVNYKRAVFNYRGEYGFFASNYSIKYTSEETIGLTLRGIIEFPLSQIVGMEIALFGNVNKIHSTACIEVYLTFGRLRDRIKPKK